MSKKTLVLGAAFAVILALLATPVHAMKGKAYGEPLTGTDTTKISELIANADEFAGKTVRVEGLITGVCEKRGCWMSLASDKEFEELRIKVDDGVIVFPLAAKGKRAVAEGVFTKTELSMEQTLSFKKHECKEHGEEFDPSTVNKPMDYYQIKATGAVIR